MFGCDGNCVDLVKSAISEKNKNLDDFNIKTSEEESILFISALKKENKNKNLLIKGDLVEESRKDFFVKLNNNKNIKDNKEFFSALSESLNFTAEEKNTKLIYLPFYTEISSQDGGHSTAMVINNENKDKPEFYLFDTSLALCDNGQPSVRYFGEFLNKNMTLINRRIQYGNVCALMVFSLGYVLSRDNSSYTNIESIKLGFDNNNIVYELSNFLQQLIPSNVNDNDTNNKELFIKSFDNVEDYYRIPGSDYLINKNFYSINRFLNIGEAINDNRFSNYFKVVYNIDYFVKKYQHSAKEEEIANILKLIKNKDTSINDDNIDNITNAWNEDIFKDGKFKYMDVKSIGNVSYSNSANKAINVSSSNKNEIRSKTDSSDSILKSYDKSSELMGSDELTRLNNNNEIVVGWGHRPEETINITREDGNEYRRIIYTLETQNNSNANAGCHYVAAEIFTLNNRTIVVHRDSLNEQLNQEFINYVREYISASAIIVNIHSHSLRQNENELNCGPLALQNLEYNSGIVDITRRTIISINNLSMLYFINSYTNVVDLAEIRNNNVVPNNIELIDNNINLPNNEETAQNSFDDINTVRTNKYDNEIESNVSNHQEDGNDLRQCKL